MAFLLGTAASPLLGATTPSFDRNQQALQQGPERGILG
jgi:hypothetical protein